MQAPSLRERAGGEAFLLFTNGAYDKNCYPLTSVDELQQLTSHEYYQQQLTAYRSGDAEAKRKLAALIPQGRLKNPTIRLHQAEHLVPSGWVFLDDDRPTEVITAEERHRLVEERLAQVGLTHMPHVAQRSASMKYHLLVTTPSNIPLSGEAAQLKDVWEWWQRFFEGILVLDPSTVNVNRLMFLTGEWLTPVDALFEAMGEVESEKMKDESSLPNGINFPLSSLNFQLETIAERLIESLCGTTTPPEGSRNNTLYEAARQMAYLDGITEERMLAAFAPLGYLGLPEREARQCIRSAMRHEKTWKYTLPPELSQALEEVESGKMKDESSCNPTASTAEVRRSQSCSPPDGHFPLCFSLRPATYGSSFNFPLDKEGNNFPLSSFNFPLKGTSVPELVSLFTPLVPENAHEAVAAMVFAPLGSYLNNTVTIRDVSGKRRNLQFTSLVVGNSSSGKGFTDIISDLITERHRQRDLSSWAQIEAWQEQKRATPKGEAAPLKPQVPLHLLASNMTEPALLERLKALEPTHGRAYIKVAEIDDLRKMQTVVSSRLGAGQEIILAAFDTAPYGAIRVSADAVSTMTVMSLNIVASSTYPGMQDFFRSGIERGSVGRCDIAIVPDSYDVPRYHDPTPQFHEQLAHYIDLLEQATGEIACPDIDRTIEDIRQEYSHPDSPLSYHHNPEHYKLCHRQLLITKQKATILYICNDYRWDPTWEPWLHHAFHYGMQCKLEVFATEIASWEKRQQAHTLHILTTQPKSELTQLPATFTTTDLVALKRAAAPEAEDSVIIKRTREQLRQWAKRGHITPIGNDGQQWQQN